MTKQINTGIAELLLLLLPEGVTECQPRWIEGKDVLQQLSIAVYGSTIDIELPDGNWEELGIAHELTEEVWSTIVEHTGFHMGLPTYKDYGTDDLPYDTTSATESGLSLLAANDVYAVNPYGDQPHNTGLVHLYPTGDEIMDASLNEAIAWNKAQQNTGKWVLLKKIEG